MTPPSVSVIVVSRGRPDALRLCLTGIAQLHYPNFEVIVVADPEGLEAAKQSPLADHAKLVPFDEANISAARNAGVDAAAGDVVAFVDDDAVPEPTWLTHLCAPFAQSDVAAAGGYVRGRNGISYQWTARSVDRFGMAHPLEVPGDAPHIVHPAPAQAVKTEGTNMAMRRDVLVQMGGFDPAYRFYLDETDVNVRLAQAGHATAIVPLAQVHHGFAASDKRRTDRVPLDLTEIGASWAVFQCKYIAEADRAAHWQRVCQSERRRAIELMMAGRIEPREVRRLMRTLREGYQDGRARRLSSGQVSAHANAPFAPCPGGNGRHHLIAARRTGAAQAHADARAAVKDGSVVTLLILSRTSLYHHARFHPDGYWLQQGGLYGKALRSEPVFRAWRFDSRVAQEARRIKKTRQL